MSTDAGARVAHQFFRGRRASIVRRATSPTPRRTAGGGVGERDRVDRELRNYLFDPRTGPGRAWRARPSHAGQVRAEAPGVGLAGEDAGRRGSRPRRRPLLRHGLQEGPSPVRAIVTWGRVSRGPGRGRPGHDDASFGATARRSRRPNRSSGRPVRDFVRDVRRAIRAGRARASRALPEGRRHLARRGNARRRGTFRRRSAASTIQARAGLDRPGPGGNVSERGSSETIAWNGTRSRGRETPRSFARPTALLRRPTTQRWPRIARWRTRRRSRPCARRRRATRPRRISSGPSRPRHLGARADVVVASSGGSMR